MSKLFLKKNNNHTFGEQIPILLMLVPFTFFFLLFTIIPIVSSVALGFTSYDLLGSLQFVGIDNFKRLFLDDEVFAIVVKNTVVFAIIAGPVGFLLSFILAWFVNEFSRHVRTFLSFMFYSPALVGNAYFIWKVLFSGDSYGYLNSLLLSTGVITEPVIWLKTPSYLMTIIIIVQIWSSMGVSFLSNISGLQNVSIDLYEAAAIDGVRNRWQELRYITLPCMSHIPLFSAVMQIQSSFSAGAISSALAGYPSVEYSADMLIQYMEDVGTVKFEMGYASALSVVLFFIMFAARIIIGKALSKNGGNN